MKSKYKLFIYFVLSIFSNFFVSCGFDMHVNEENAKYSLEKNIDSLNRIVNFFNKQEQVLSITRRDYRFVPYGKIYDLFGMYNTQYSLTVGGLKPKTAITFEVIGNEKSFFDQDLRKIKTQDDNLSDFLIRNEIDFEMFKKLINIMYDYKMYSISKAVSDDAVMISYGILDGLLYSQNPNITKDNPRYIQINKISESWYYFKEKY